MDRFNGPPESAYLMQRFLAELEHPTVDDRARLTRAIKVAPNNNVLHRTPGFEAFIEGLGLSLYWRNTEWPDYCRPNGENLCLRYALTRLQCASDERDRVRMDREMGASLSYRAGYARKQRTPGNCLQ